VELVNLGVQQVITKGVGRGIWDEQKKSKQEKKKKKEGVMLANNKGAQRKICSTKTD